MHLPLRIKFFAVAAAVAVIALGSAMWAVSYQLKSHMTTQIGQSLVSAESSFAKWRTEQENYLKAEAQIVAHDPRFFAAIADGDPATATQSAREFQKLARSDLFLVVDEQGRRLANLDESGAPRSLDWPAQLPPSGQTLRWDDRLYLITSLAVTVGNDTVGYLGLGHRVDSQLASEIGRVAGAELIFFGYDVVYGSTLPQQQDRELIGPLANDHSAAQASLGSLVMQGERFLYRTGSLDDGGEARYAVVMSLDTRLKPEIADLSQTLLWIASAALAVALVISWTVAKRVTAHVPDLVRAVKAVAGGQYEHPVTHPGHDEFRLVAVAVDHMRQELVAQMQAIRKANAEKLASERMAVVGKMASTIIHDFKTPMQVIRSAVEMLSDENTSPERRSRYVQMMLGEVDRMVGMAQDLLGYARGDRRMARTAVAIDPFIEEAAAAWREMSSSRGITISCALSSGLTLAIDRDKIRRTLDNIFVNAMEVLDSGGLVALTTTRDGDRALITITDNGPGIPEEIRTRIFEPFATFGKEQGTGLGLAMAKKTVDDHGGEIEVVSAPGTGASFRVSLPVNSASLSFEEVEKSISGEVIVDATAV
jgi:signal transduction histidine kinase